MSEHALLSASSSKKWLNCPLSVKLESHFEDEESSYAREGTIAHALGELKLKLAFKEIVEEEYITQKTKLLKDLPIEQIRELDYYTEEYKDFVLERHNKSLSNFKEVSIKIEKRLDYSRYAPKGFGTGDIVICDYENIEIIDLKYGKGVKVNAFENSQLMLYGLGALEIYDEFFDISKVTLTIFQPRIDNISSFEISKDDLVKWGEEVVKPKAIKAFKGEGKCVYGLHCDEGFCKARPVCKAYALHHSHINTFSNKDPNLLTDEELYEVYELAISSKSWLKTMEDYILTKLLKGEEIKGLKLVEGRSNRTFTDENKVMLLLEQEGVSREEYIKEKLISLTNIEKMLGKQKFKDILGAYVHKPQGSPTIAKLEDERPTYSRAVADFS